MHYKRRKARKRAREATNKVGVWPWLKPRVKGNAWDRFRVKDYGRKVADMAEMEVEAPMNIRVILNNVDPTAGGIEMYRIPVEASAEGNKGAFGTGLRGPAQHSVLVAAKAMFEEEPLVREVRARHGDVEVRLDVMLDEVRQKRGLEAVAPLVEHIVSRVAEEFFGSGTPNGKYLFCCPICLKDVEWKDWDSEENTCESCRWDKEEDESLRSDWADDSR